MGFAHGGNRTLASEVRVRCIYHKTMMDTYVVLPKNKNK